MLVKYFERKREILSNPVISPFKHLADVVNPFVGTSAVEALIDEKVQELPPHLLAYFDPLRPIVFSRLVDKVYEFALLCVDPEIWKIGTKEEIKEGLKTIKSKIEEINTLLRHLVAKDATKKKVGSLRVFELFPSYLVAVVDKSYRPILRPYLAPSYKGKRNKMEDIIEFWEAEIQKPFPKRIYIDDRTETTIVLSILAHQSFCPYSQLSGLYYKAKKQINASQPT